ncbi:MAG TPA: TadE/TadG family type IV pilus assembly protein [Methylobacterium sp.]
MTSLRTSIAGGRAPRPDGRQLLQRFRASDDGLAILEFSLILPILLTLYFGTIELCNMMAQVRKVDLLSRTVGDLVAGISTPTRAQVDDIFQSAKVVLLPFDSAGAEMVVSAVGVFGNQTSGQMRVCSSVAAGASPRTRSESPSVALPDSLKVDGMRLLLVEIRMKYKPIAAETFASLIGQRVDGITFSKQVLWPIRFGRRFASQHPEVVLPSGAACPPRF